MEVILFSGVFVFLSLCGDSPGDTRGGDPEGNAQTPRTGRTLL